MDLERMGQNYSKWGVHIYDDTIYFDVNKLEEKLSGYCSLLFFILYAHAMRPGQREKAKATIP